MQVLPKDVTGGSIKKGISVKEIGRQPINSLADTSPTAAKELSSIFGQRQEFPEDLLNKISDQMGQQPRPKGKSHEVRLALGISRQSIDYAIKQLIARGIFKPQVNGVLYEPSTTPEVVK